MTKKTDKEVSDEIAALREIKPKVRQYSAFGDNHHAAIDAQICVLDNGYDEDAFADEPDNIRDAAREADDWRNGYSEQKSLVSGDGWESLAK